MILLKVGEFLGLPDQIVARFLSKTRPNSRPILKPKKVSTRPDFAGLFWSS